MPVKIAHCQTLCKWQVKPLSRYDTRKCSQGGFSLMLMPELCLKLHFWSQSWWDTTELSATQLVDTCSFPLRHAYVASCSTRLHDNDQSEGEIPNIQHTECPTSISNRTYSTGSLACPSEVSHGSSVLIHLSILHFGSNCGNDYESQAELQVVQMTSERVLQLSSIENRNYCKRPLAFRASLTQLKCASIFRASWEGVWFSSLS